MLNFKLKNSKTFYFLFFLSLIFAMSCKNTNRSEVDNTQFEAAELLQRGTQIQLGKEWDKVQNNYSKFTKILSDDPNNNKIKIQLAQLYIKEARVTGEHGHYYPGALAVIDNALNNETITDDLRFLALTTKAGVELSLHDFKKALKTGNKAALLNPNNAQIHGVLVDANVELGNYNKAVALSDRMMTIKPDIRSYSRASYLREIHGDIEGSKAAMMMAVKAGLPGTEETAWAMLTMGDIYKEYGVLDTAELIYNSILEMRPNYPFAIGGLAEISMLKNDLGLAESKLNEAINIIPEVGFYINLAHIYKIQNRHDELNSTVEEILIMLKDDTDSGHNMNLEYADLYLELLNDPVQAMEFANMEYMKRPKNIDVNLMMAKINVKLGNNNEVADYITKADVTNSKNPKLLALKGLI